MGVYIFLAAKRDLSFLNYLKTHQKERAYESNQLLNLCYHRLAVTSCDGSCLITDKFTPAALLE